MGPAPCDSLFQPKSTTDYHFAHPAMPPNMPFPIEEDEVTRSYALDGDGNMICFWHRLRFCVKCRVDFSFKTRPKYTNVPKATRYIWEKFDDDSNQWDFSAGANDSAVDLESVQSLCFPEEDECTAQDPSETADTSIEAVDDEIYLSDNEEGGVSIYDVYEGNDSGIDDVSETSLSEPKELEAVPKPEEPKIDPDEFDRVISAAIDITFKQFGPQDPMTEFFWMGAYLESLPARYL